MNKISFEYLRNIFPKEHWDIGFLSEEALKQCAYSPVKWKFHPNGVDFSNDIHFMGLTNSIVLVRDGATWDYSFYDEAVDILNHNNVKDWFQVYTNYKAAGVLGGVGVQARNSLVYSYQFGFDCHICVIGFNSEIVDVPSTLRVNAEMWSRCKGCSDCAKACPVGAIHNEKKPYWLDSSKCDNFIYLGDHESIPSIKSFWYEHVHPEMPNEIVKNMKTFFDVKQVFGNSNLPFDNNGYEFDGNMTKKDGKQVNVPVCRECTSQPRCSKWGGKYPYESAQPIIWMNRDK